MGDGSGHDGREGAPFVRGVDAHASGPALPRRGEDLEAQQRAVRELELGTASDDAPRLGPMGAGPAAVLLAAASVVLLWVLGGFWGAALAVVAGAAAVVQGRRAVRAAHHERTRAWWLGTIAVAAVLLSAVGAFAAVVASDKGGTGTPCVFTGECHLFGGR